MSTLMAMVDTIAALPLAEQTPENNEAANDIRDRILGWVAPIASILIAAIAVSFLIKRQMTQFVQFLVIAIIVGLLIYQGGNLLDWGGQVFSNLLGLDE